MRTFIIAVALVGSCLAVPETVKTVGYEIPSGKVSFSSSVPVEGVNSGVHHPVVKSVQGGVYGGDQPAVHSVYGGAQPVVRSVYEGVQPGVKTVFEGVQPVYGGVQPVVKSVFEGVQPVVKTAHEGVHSTVYGGVQPLVKSVYGVGVQPYVKSVHEVHPVAKPVYYGVQPVVKSVYGGVQPAYKSVVEGVQPVVKSVYGGVQPAYKPLVSGYHHVPVYGDYVQPAVNYQVSPKVNSFVPQAYSVTPVVQKYFAEARFGYPSAHQVVSYPKVSYPVVPQEQKVVEPVLKYASPVVEPVAKYSPVERVDQFPAVQAFHYPQTVVQPKFRQVTPVFSHGVVSHGVETPSAIISQTQGVDVDGSFVSNFQTENGIQSSVSGAVKPVVGSDEPAQVMSGSYSYTSPDGTPVVTTWYADENGFHADGDHIPAVPEEIQRSLQYIHSYPVHQEVVK